MSSPELSLNLRYTKSELYRATCDHVFHQIWYWPTVCAIVAVIALIATWNSYEPVLLIGCLIAFYVCGIPRLLLRQTVKNPAMLGPITMSFSDKGISTQLVNANAFVDWSYVKGAREGTSRYMIKTLRNAFYLVPKAQITQAQSDQLREILRANVLKNVSLAKTAQP